MSVQALRPESTTVRLIPGERLRRMPIRLMADNATALAPNIGWAWAAGTRPVAENEIPCSEGSAPTSMMSLPSFGQIGFEVRPKTSLHRPIGG